MINPDAPSFYLLRAAGECAELIASTLSVSTMGDIESVTIISNNFDNDIEPINELEFSMSIIKEGLDTLVNESVHFNPLYIPSGIEAIDSILEQGASNTMLFVGAERNPYLIKTISLTTDLETLIEASVSYQKFDFPSYEEIVEGQTKALLN